MISLSGIHDITWSHSIKAGAINKKVVHLKLGKRPESHFCLKGEVSKSRKWALSGFYMVIFFSIFIWKNTCNGCSQVWTIWPVNRTDNWLIFRSLRCMAQSHPKMAENKRAVLISSNNSYIFMKWKKISCKNETLAIFSILNPPPSFLLLIRALCNWYLLKQINFKTPKWQIWLI